MRPKDRRGQEFINTILSNFAKRFPSCWRNKTPFNCLTFLDPRYVDLYADTENLMDKIRLDIKTDSVYDSILVESYREEAQISTQERPTFHVHPVEDVIEATEMSGPQPSIPAVASTSSSLVPTSNQSGPSTT